MRSALPLVVEVAHKPNLPVLADATAAPASNLRRVIAEGADLVVFGGGKALEVLLVLKWPPADEDWSPPHSFSIWPTGGNWTCPTEAVI